MNAWQLAEDFRQAFENDGAFADAACVHAQDSAELAAPFISFGISADPIDSKGKVGSFTLAAEVNGSSTVIEGAPAPEITHAALAEAVREKLLGAGRVALLAALEATGRWDFRGWSATPEEPGTQALRFVTPVRIKGVVIEL